MAIAFLSLVRQPPLVVGHEFAGQIVELGAQVKGYAVGEIVSIRPHGTTPRSTDPSEELGEEVCVWWQADDAALIGD